MRLTKHHGLGNDFLVLLDLDRGPDGVAGGDLGGLAKAVCDRRRGVGADGLIVAGPAAAGADVVMVLHNADGGRAEMSGNGVRCLGQAVARHRGVDTVDLAVATDAGVRRLAVRPGPDRGTASVSVEMGPVTITRSEPGRAEADTGNPHLVLLVDDPAGVDLLELGHRHPDVNVEVIAAGPEPDALTLRVHERGAGLTEACGTGSCAAAAVAHGWGLVGPAVVVHNPGGDLAVDLGPAGAVLTGPAVHVADVDVDLDGLGAPWR